MVGKKAHEQQRRIIEKRVDTSNAGKEFDPRPDLERAKRGLAPVSQRSTKTVSDPARPDDLVHRGHHQESSHNKHGGRE
jgi:hypothetical protein